MEVSLGIWNYHQLSICIRYTYYLILEKLIRIREDTNFTIQQAGHSDATKEQIYSFYNLFG